MSDEQTRQANRQLVMHGYGLFKQGDIQGVLDMCADCVEWFGHELDAVPFSGVFRGKAGMADFFARLSQSVEAEQFEPQTFLADDDKVAVTGIARWRVRDTGITYDDRWVQIFTVRDGKISRMEQYGDTAAIEAAFMSPQPTMAQGENILRH